MRTFNYHADSSHGWLAVKIDLIQELGIADKISQYSYIRGNTVYLEEDVDAVLFHKAYTAKHGQYETETKYYDRRSPIRSYKPFTPDKIGAIKNHNRKFDPLKKEKQS